MILPWAIQGRFEHAVPYPVQHHITTNFGSGYAKRYLARSGESPRSRRRVEQNLAFGFGMRREESTPGFVVAEATSSVPLAVEEVKPILHVCFGHPHSLWPSPRVEDHDIGQGPSVPQQSTEAPDGF